LADTNPQRAARAANRYEVRAVWRKTMDGCVSYCVSQPAEAFDTQPMERRAPDGWGAYAIAGGHIEDHPTRAAAERHAGQLNGERS
jgi:hypothetical protein